MFLKNHPGALMLSSSVQVDHLLFAIFLIRRGDRYKLMFNSICEYSFYKTSFGLCHQVIIAIRRLQHAKRSDARMAALVNLLARDISAVALLV